jgi:hypothetical protein
MAYSSYVISVLLLIAADAAPIAPAPAPLSASAPANDKQAAVDKVIEELELLQVQVVAEGEKEAATYDKFACWCKTMTIDKTKAIKKGHDQKAQISAEIEKLIAERDELEKRISDLTEEIGKANKEMAKAKKLSDEEFAEYEKNKEDLAGALFGLKEAIKVLKSSEKPSLLQLKSISSTVRTAALLADALGLDVPKRADMAFLQQDPEVPMEDYKFHSTGIIETLEELQDSFRKTMDNINADEVRRVKEYTLFKQKNTDFVKSTTQELDESKETKDRKVEEIAESSQELTTVSADLAANIEYMKELSKGCSEKAQTWDQRSKVRVQELTAITECHDIVAATVLHKTFDTTVRLAQTGSVLHTADVVANDEGSLEAIEAAAENSEAYTFLQRKSQSKSILAHRIESVARDPRGEEASREMVVNLLKSKGVQLKSTLLMSLAQRIGADPFGKIKKLIQELIERLLTEAANEADQKGWCDKSIADAKQKREIAASKTAELNAVMARTEATIDKLKEEIEELAGEIADLHKAQAEAGQMRSEEKAENQNTVIEAEMGLDATKMALDILEKFYKTAAKAKIELSLLSQDPMDEAPETTFETGEAYTGVQGASGGIIGMMEVIRSDFERTIKSTREAEKAAEQEYTEYMTESGMSLAEKDVAIEQKKKYKDEAEEKYAASTEELTTQTGVVQTAVEELMKLKPVCIDTGMSYEERVALREEEIAALKKALCILGAYAKFGPDGLADAC